MVNDNSSWIKRTLPLWTGQFVSLFGSGIVQFAIVWYLTEETGSKVVLALATYMATIPGILLGSSIGHFVDRYNKKATMILADLVSAGMILILVLLLYLNLASVPLVLFIMLVRSICAQFQSSALFAVIPQLIPENSLEKVAGLRQTIDGILNMVSIPIAAFLLSLWKIHAILSIDIITAVMGILLLLFVRIPGISSPGQPSEKTDFRKLIEGYRLLVSYRFVFYKSLISSSINLALAPALTFLPLLIKENLHRGPETLAMLQVATGLGIVSGGMVMSGWGGFSRRMVTVLLGLGMLGLSLLSGGIIINLGYIYPLIAPMFLAGMSISIANSSSGAITQSKVRKEDMGKVAGASSSISQLMIPVGLLIAMPVSEIIGLTGWYIAAGLFSLVIVFISCLNRGFLNYSIRRAVKI